MNAFEKKVTPLFILKFTLPSMVMMIFNSIYVMVDGVFVSNFVDTDALSAINIVFPITSFVMAVGIMLGCGGSAVVGTQLGEGNHKKARESFTFITVAGTVIGLISTIICLMFTEEMVTVLGADTETFQYAYDYIYLLSFFNIASILQTMFQFLFVTAGKPNWGLISTIGGGIANIILDYVFIVVLSMGIAGAALATAIGYIIPVLMGFVYFGMNRKGLLYFVKPVFSLQTFIKSCYNGSSEMVSNLSIAITTFLFNITMMKYLGSDGVAAMSIVLYAQFLFTAVFFGYSAGVAPLISYNYGSKDEKKLKALFKISTVFICVSSVLAFVLAIVLDEVIVNIFANTNEYVVEITTHGMSLFAVGFLFMGINIFASNMFTALSNGKVSAFLSFLRSFVFLIVAIIVLPNILEVDGIWLAIPLAEFLALITSVVCIVKFKKTYGY